MNNLLRYQGPEANPPMGPLPGPSSDSRPPATCRIKPQPHVLNAGQYSKSKGYLTQKVIYCNFLLHIPCVNMKLCLIRTAPGRWKTLWIPVSRGRHR